jgi:hypothetical protein
MTIPARRRTDRETPPERVLRPERHRPAPGPGRRPSIRKAVRRARRTPAGARLRPSCRRARNARGPAARRVRLRPSRPTMASSLRLVRRVTSARMPSAAALPRGRRPAGCGRIMQREVVMITGGERQTVAREPGARVAADGQSLCAQSRLGARSQAGYLPSLSHRGSLHP